MPRLLISAAHKSSGKTTVSIGLCSALTQRGLKIQPFKKGPDYIDPMWLGAASGRSCRNLDFYLMGRDEIIASVQQHAAGADLSLIEGNKGLYDGLDLDGSNSNAALAELLHAPVVLVIDARGMTRGIAPLILGYQAFDRNIRIAGVILNNLGGARHEGKLRAVIEHYTDVSVLGAVHHDPRLQITERHLGLMPSNESTEALQHILQIGQVVGSQVDLDTLIRIANSATTEDPVAIMPEATTNIVLNKPPTLRIGVARDQAFGFYYEDDLQAMRAEGAEIVIVDTLSDAKLPGQLDGLFIGGGFPELFMDQLEQNSSLRQDIHDAIESGLPTYAECGGLMYLARSLSWQGKTRKMAGVIPGDVVMHGKPVGRGYVRVRSTGQCPWPGEESGKELLAHEFHYSSLENLESGLKYAFDVKRGHGIDGKRDGIVYKNLLACYTHFRSLHGYNWAKRFMEFVRQEKSARQQ
ncbi:MAG: cobyrinate a,c-diamide synthase [Gammaproteobacteria bacterium]|nr:cobyrinate a,c-diamide synthase [Gammaproteobacteria bacterium]MBU1731699.1 cobyrinate a,c-diamide synthase [Gammaproteobacteria bacterium]MBU1892523.1 cobyrinate a,c-diamide synthase [Gammaproteobacteria bacterium]